MIVNEVYYVSLTKEISYYFFRGEHKPENLYDSPFGFDHWEQA